VVGCLLILVPAARHWRTVFEDPFKARVTTTRIEKSVPGGPKTVQTTTAEAKESIFDRALAAGGLLLLRLGLVAIAAFVAAALVQRAILANFEIQAGPVKIPKYTGRVIAASRNVLSDLVRQTRANTDAAVQALEAAGESRRKVGELDRRLTELEARWPS
jgi:hypothetical protein